MKRSARAVSAARLAMPALVLALSAALLPPRIAAAQEKLTDDVHLSVDLSPDSLTVGDPVLARLLVRTPPATQVRFAAEQKLGNEVQILDFKEHPSRVAEDSGETLWEAQYTLAIYATGEKMLPPLVVQVQRDSLAAVVASDSIFVYVASVLDDSLAAGNILDIKGQRDLRVPWPLWVWILIAAAVIALLVAVWWWRRRNRRPVVVHVEPLRPAHEIALAALRKLETKRLPLDGHIKEHYIQLSEILRSYLEAAPVFGIPALEETTDEIVRSLQDRGTVKERVTHVQLLCEEADLVKFAKHQPPIDECMEGIERVAAFVRQTSRLSDNGVTIDHGATRTTPDNGATPPGAPA
jgi:hypothetical protein